MAENSQMILILPILIRFMIWLGRNSKPYSGKGGYGFYMWHDTDGHFVENVTAKSPADKGL